MSDVSQMPLQEVLQALSRTPVTQPQLRAALATTAARWHLLLDEEAEAIRLLGHALEMVPDLRPAMRLLYRIYLDRGDVRSAVMYLDQEIRATRHPREAGALYRERGLLVEAHFHDLSAAQQCYQAALKATPRDLAVLRSVERVSLARGDLFWLIANLEAQLEVAQDPALNAGILHDLALLETRHKGDLHLAQDLVLAALEAYPNHLVLATDLFRIAEVAGDAELMLLALEIEAEARPPERRAMPLVRASVILREHKERSSALDLLHAAAVAQPHNFSLWRSLEELSTATSRYPVALAACVGQLRAVGDAEDNAVRAEIFYRLGKLALFRLDRPIDGLAAMRKAIRLMPGHPAAMEDTGRFLNANGMWSQALELIELEIATAREGGLTSEELALCHLRAGQLMEERIGEPEGARRFYEEATKIDPDYRPARDRLERILHQVGDAEGLRLYYSDELERATTPARRGFLLQVLGQLHSEQGDPERSIEYLEAVLAETPDHLPSLQLLARLLARSDQSDELLRITQQEIELTSSPARQAKLLHRAGELAVQLEQRDEARKCFARALEVVDDHLPSLESLGRLLREDEDYPALVELLRKELLYANDRARQAGLQLEIATILSAKLGRKVEALSELESLLARWPRHLPALHAAESLAAATGNHTTLLTLLEQHIASVSGPRTRALLLHRTASIRSTLEDYEGAIRDLVRALDLWPQLGVARARLLRLYEMLGRSTELQSFAEAGLTSERGADDRRAMALQLAELTPKPVVAIQYLGAVAEARPEDYVSQLRLAQACHRAARPSREAGALAAAADRFAEQVSPDEPAVIALRYLAGRAEESAGNLDAADRAYAQILDQRSGDALARQGRQRIKGRKRESAFGRNIADLQASAEQAEHEAHRAAYLTIAAEMHERRLDLRAAETSLDAAIEACPAYLPALHARARVLERLGDATNIDKAIGTLEQLVQRQRDPRHRAKALCHAGTLALRIGTTGDPNSRAWSLFTLALRNDPTSARAFRGLRRTRDIHGTQGAQPLQELLMARLVAMKTAKELRGASLRELVHLAGDVDGPAAAVALLEAGADVEPEHPGIFVDLAQAHARLGNWPDVVQACEAALSREMSPERKAALHYFAGEANERANDLSAAVPHFIAAGQGGFHVKHALSAADRLAARSGDLERRVEALQLLVDAGDGPERVRSLRQLAEIHRGPLKQPDVAVDLMRELLLLRPTDIDVLTELRRLLEKLDRKDEALAAVLAGVAHHRAWLRSAGAPGLATSELDLAPLTGLLRLFDAMGELDGVYVAACVLEVIAPAQLPAVRRPDTLVREPWPLPKPLDGRPLDGLVGDLPCPAALDLLRECFFYLDHVPGAPEQTVDLSPTRSLPASSSVVMVVQALSSAMGLAQPLVFLDNAMADGVIAHAGPSPSLIVGRRVGSTPFGPAARDDIGRALLRLSTGGDALHHHTDPGRIVALLVAIANGVGVDVDAPDHLDWDYASTVADALPPANELAELRDSAAAFAATTARFDPLTLLQSLQMAEDRAGAACAADPRPALARIQAAGEIESHRGRMLIGYLLSDDHLTLRRNLGYETEFHAARRTNEQEARV
jgi:tetratricopeptide (TPR) repeat protein